MRMVKHVRQYRWAVALVAGGTVVAALAGCTGTSGSATAPAGTTPASGASSPGSPASSAPATASASSVATTSSPAATQAAGLPSCATADLQAKAGLAQGTAGSVYQVIDFTNIGSAACTLYGYPGVALAAGTPVTQVGAAAARSNATAATLVTLQPGATGNALLRITEAENYSASECDPTPTTYLQIYPPNQTTPIYLSYTSTGCASTAVNLLSIDVVTAGSGSSSS